MVPTMDRRTGESASLWQQLVGTALELPTSSIPEAILSRTCERIVDTVGAALAAAASNEGLSAHRVVLAESEGGIASVWASGGKTRSAALACLANGTLAHAIDYDDTHAASTLHPGAVIVPAAIAAGEEVGADGPDLLASVALGYEIAARLAMQAPGKFQRQGFQPTAILGIFGATAAVARLMNASLAVATNAGGIAGSLAAGIMEYLSDGSDVKQLHAGWMAQGAVRAVQFATSGLAGPRTVLEGPKGVFRAFVSEAIDPRRALDGLGDQWLGMEVATKLYPACYCVHAVIDAWRVIAERDGVTQADHSAIRRLTALVPEFYLQLVAEPLEQKRRPRTTYEARFSLPFAVATAVVHGPVTLESYARDRLENAKVLDMMSKVDYEVVQYATFPGEFPGGLRVDMSDGRVLEAHVDFNPGGPRNPLPENRVGEKILDAARCLQDEAGGQALLASLRFLREPGSDLRPFSKAMTRFSA